VSKSSISNSTNSSSSSKSSALGNGAAEAFLAAGGSFSTGGFAAGAANALKMSSSSLNPLPSSSRETVGDAATDSATNFPGSDSFFDFGDALVSDFLAAVSVLAAAADTFGEGTIFDGSFSSKLKPKKSPGISSLLFEATGAAVFSAPATPEFVSSDADEPESGFLDRPPRLDFDLEPLSTTGSDATWLSPTVASASFV
jgi:hypothetical protein